MDICRVLDIKNPRDAVSRFDGDDVGTTDVISLLNPLSPHTMNEILQFENHTVRMVGTPDNPWWVGKDLCDLLGYKRYENTLARMPENETSYAKLAYPSGAKEMITVNEPGLYRLIFGSKLPTAEAFKTYVFTEVLPAIRKHGSYHEDSRRSAEARFVGMARDLMDLGLWGREACQMAWKIFNKSPSAETDGPYIDLAKEILHLSGDPVFTPDLVRRFRNKVSQFNRDHPPGPPPPTLL